MADSGDVLTMLCPNSKWSSVGNTYEGITWYDEPGCSKEEFEAGFAQYDAWKAEQEAQAQAKREALLDKLGITQEEAKLLLS
jgi:hypothetical protein